MARPEKMGGCVARQTRPTRPSISRSVGHRASDSTRCTRRPDVRERRDGPSMGRAQSACGSLLPAPAEQTQSDEAGGEEWEGSGQWSVHADKRPNDVIGNR
jgi:hypothetical protein